MATRPVITDRGAVASAERSRARLVPLEDALHVVQKRHRSMTALVFGGFGVTRTLGHPREVAPQVTQLHGERLGTQLVAN